MSSPVAERPPLLDPGFMRLLERWSLVVRRTTSGAYGGERRSRRRGQSVEFADFRNYVPGDDVRFVDWNLYARLERLFLKLFLHEQELNVLIAVDLSESMTFGDPSKALLARKIAAAIGYLALARGDGATIAVGGGGGRAPVAMLPPCRGRGSAPRMIEFLRAAPEGGSLAFAPFVESALTRFRGVGLVVLIGDLLDREGFEPALRPVVARRHEAIVVHTFDREEWDPTATGDLKFVDAEDGGAEEITATPAVLREYRRRVRAWSDEIDGWCKARGLTYLRAMNDESPEDAVLKTLSRLGRTAPR